MTNDDTERHWTVDRRVPLALLIVIAVQFAGLVWWGASIDNRTEHAITGLAEASARIGALEARQSAADTSRARIEERLVAQSATLIRIERLLERMAEERERRP